MSEGKRFRLTVTLEEDLHTGTGMGRGAEVDFVQARDRRGRPVIRATHLKGLLRWQAEALRHLDACTEAEVRGLFGGGGARARGALLLSSLRQPGDAAGRFVLWTSAARERDSRAPMDDTLHSVEYIAAGTELRCELALRDPELAGLLDRCARRIDRLGGKRQRGAGRVLTSLEPVTPEGNEGPGVPDDTHTRLRLVLKNLDPLCLPRTGAPGALAVSEGFIRAQVLRGSLTQWLLDQGRRADRMLDRRIVVGNAAPLPADVSLSNDRAAIERWDVVPIPLVIGTPKPGARGGNAHGPWWVARSEGDRLGAKGERYRYASKDEDLKRPGDREWLFREGAAPWRRYAPVMGVHLRNQVPDDRRAEEARTDLFAEEEIAEDTLFLADLRFPDVATAAAVAEGLAPILGGAAWLAVGRGGRPVEVVAARWCTPAERAREARTGDFTLTLESDLIARDAMLGFHESLGAGVLAALVEAEDMSGISADRLFCDRVEVRGFNAASGLPRAPLGAIRRGSSVRVTGIGADALRVKLAARDHLGERGWDGFGRFRIDFDPLSEVDDAARGESPEDPNVAVRVEVGRSEAILGRARAFAKKHPGEKRPKPSQWQALREKALIAKDTTDLVEFIVELQRRAGTLGGAAWKTVDLEELKREVSAMDLEDARLFVDAAVRWWLVEARHEARP